MQLCVCVCVWTEPVLLLQCDVRFVIRWMMMRNTGWKGGGGGGRTAGKDIYIYLLFAFNQQNGKTLEFLIPEDLYDDCTVWNCGSLNT